MEPLKSFSCNWAKNLDDIKGILVFETGGRVVSGPSSTDTVLLKRDDGVKASCEMELKFCEGFHCTLVTCVSSSRNIELYTKTKGGFTYQGTHGGSRDGDLYRTQIKLNEGKYEYKLKFLSLLKPKDTLQLQAFNVDFIRNSAQESQKNSKHPNLNLANLINHRLTNSTDSSMDKLIVSSMELSIANKVKEIVDNKTKEMQVGLLGLFDFRLKAIESKIDKRLSLLEKKLECVEARLPNK